MEVDFSKLGLAKLNIIHYPDPRLRKRAAAVERFDEQLAALARRMLEMMREAKGVGLAAPQLGLPLRLFVMNATEDPANDLVVINPQISDGLQIKEAEEGCLSIPEVRVNVRRPSRVHLRAQDVTGQSFELEGADLAARVWQHETDHLDGVLIIDRMSPSDKIAVRKSLKDLETKFHKKSSK